MATQSPFNESRVDVLVSDSINLKVKTLTKIICYLFNFLVIGECIFLVLTRSMPYEYKLILFVCALLESTCYLAALYGINAVRPGFLIPMILLFALRVGVACGAAVAVFAVCIFNVVNFLDHNSNSFFEGGTFTNLVLCLVFVLIFCALLYIVCRCYEYLRAEKKATENLASDQNDEIRDYHSAESGVKLVTISEL